MGFGAWWSRQGAGRGELKVCWSLICLSQTKYKVAGLLDINKGKNQNPQLRKEQIKVSCLQQNFWWK